MLEALGMQLEPVRVVRENRVNSITVCRDLRRDAGVLYTVVCITEPETRRTAAAQAAGGVFSRTADYIGSYTRGEGLNLVFRYRGENRLSSHQAQFAVDFAHRRTLAENFLTACAESGVDGPAGLLLLEEENLNLGANGSVYFNWFLDFAKWKPLRRPNDYYTKAASIVFELLAPDFARRTGSLDNYPPELQVLYKKADAGNFSSMGSLLAFVRALPDAPQMPRRGFARWLDRLQALRAWLKRHALGLFLGILVAATVIYAAWQIALRVSARRAQAVNMVYSGLGQIGEVSLEDEDA